jgi:hypothetical protein
LNVMICLGYEAAPPATPAGRGVHRVAVVVILS